MADPGLLTAQPVKCPACDRKIKSGTTDGLRQHLYCLYDCLRKSNYESLGFSASDVAFLKQGEAQWEKQHAETWYVSHKVNVCNPTGSWDVSGLNKDTNSNVGGLVEHPQPDKASFEVSGLNKDTNSNVSGLIEHPQPDKASFDVHGLNKDTNSSVSGLIEHPQSDGYGEGFAAGYQCGYERGLLAGRLGEQAGRPAGFSLSQSDCQQDLPSSSSSSSSRRVPGGRNKIPPPKCP